jgi:hypothetical protein
LDEPPPLDSSAPSTPAPVANDSKETTDLSASESEAWLESLPDSPLLIRKKRSERRTSEQTW